MAITFPSSPSTNDTFNEGSITYKWDGVKWVGIGVSPADRLVEGSNSLEINAGNDLIWTGDNVGIGNTNPTTKLSVDGGSANDATVVQIKNDSTSAYATNDGGLNTSLSLFSDGTNAAQGVGIQLYLQKSGETGCISEIGAVRESSGNSNLVFRTRDSSTGVNERARITSGGCLSIGTASPGQPSTPGIHIASDENDDCRVAFATPNKPDGRIGYYGLSNRFGIDAYNGFEIRDVADSYATRLVITSTGQMLSRSNSLQYLVLGSSGATGLVPSNNMNWIRANANNLQLNTADDGFMGFEIGGSPKFRITSSGTLIVGSSDTTDFAVHDSTNRGLNFTDSGRIYCKTDDHWDFNRPGGGLMQRFRNGNDNGNGATQTVVGNITINSASVSFNTTQSDIRLKKNIVSWTDEVLSNFKTLQPKKFHFNWQSDEDPLDTGYIAQDLVDAFPEAYQLCKTDVDGKELDRYSFNPSGMVKYLMKALQEEIVKREELEARLDAAGF